MDQSQRDDHPTSVPLDPAPPDTGQRLNEDALPVLRQRLARHASELAQLASGLAEQRRALKDTEHSMLERLGDLDDDRRLSLSQLQRAWHTQRDQLAARLRYWPLLLGGTLVLCLLSAALTLWWVEQRLEQERAAFEGQFTTVREQLEQLAGLDTRNAQIQRSLDALSGVVTRLSASLDAPAPARQPQDTAPMLPALLDTLSATSEEQRRLASELQALEARVATTSRELQSITPAHAPAPAPERSAPVRAEATPADTTSSAVLDTETRTYAVQLLGAFSHARILAFSQRPELPERLYWREERYQDRPWYVLIHSLYDSHEAAQTALASLPPELAALDLWVRTLPARTRLEVLVRKPDLASREESIKLEAP